ncbi:Retrovirus-related Pol poly [Paramuricea clavata]|uniref:Retrovirus-related Pol poly n=1 Tax=Paramuricea clavata TaxID=317549 RepID=A0A6S7KB96_PARCT|nr:Retrovirus-related Pol poly [Paramuricea clavata]
MEMAQFHLPSSLDLTDRNVAHSFKKWKRQLQVYMEASGNNNKPKQRQTAVILHCAGPQVLEVYDHFEFEGENDKNDPVKVLEKLEEYCNPRQNEVLQSFRFWQVPFQEPFHTFLTKLYSYADSCNFKEKERMIRDKIVFTVTGKQQELLLRETSLDLKKAVEICKAYEITSRNKKEMSESSQLQKIEQIAGKKSSKYPSKQHPEQQKNRNNPHILKECNFCGKSHQAIKTKCPAWGKLCNHCKGRNHFEVKCKKVHTLETKSNSDESDDSDTNWLATVEVPNKTRDIEFHYIQGSQLVIADTHSRAFLDVPDAQVRVMKVNALKGVPDERIREVQAATAQDQCMQSLLSTIKDGWPESKKDVQNDLRPYFDVRDTLSHQNGIILRGETIVIPASLRDTTKKRLHSAHLGYNSMKRRARDTIFWPGMAKEVRQLAENCEACQQPWNKVGIDLFEIKGRDYLATVDYFSGFIEVDHLSTATSKQIITKLKGHFARYGIPSEMVTDCGSQFISSEFKTFTKHWGIKHVTSSPLHHQSNGKAEAAVKTIKLMMKKSLRDNTDQYEALLELRNTPRQGTGQSPAKMMFGRATQSFLPAISNTKSERARNATQKRYNIIKISLVRRYTSTSNERMAKSNLPYMRKEICCKDEETRKKIKQLERQLASKVCEECGQKGITEQFGSLSVQDNKNESSGSSETDGRLVISMDTDQRRKRPLENEEIDGNETDRSNSDEESQFPSKADIRCPVAPCGLAALLYMFTIKKIHFCPTKFIQKYGAVTRGMAPSCTKILNNLKNLHYLTRIYECKNITEGKHNEILKEAEDELNKSAQEVGLLSYSTAEYNHCVTVYITAKQPRMQIYDAHLKKEYIQDLNQVRCLELIVLNYRKGKRPLIVKDWIGECHTGICKDEFQQFSRNENPSSLLNVLNETNRGV